MLVKRPPGWFIYPELAARKYFMKTRNKPEWRHTCLTVTSLGSWRISNSTFCSTSCLGQHPRFRITDPVWRESTGHRWIPLTQGQWCGKGFHIVTSSCWGKNVSQIYSIYWSLTSSCFSGWACLLQNDRWSTLYSTYFRHKLWFIIPSRLANG